MRLRRSDPRRPGLSRRRAGKGFTCLTLAAALRHDVEVLTLDLRGDNSRAEALYQRAGIRQYGRLPGFVAVGEARYDRLLYALDLRELRGPAEI